MPRLFNPLGVSPRVILEGNLPEESFMDEMKGLKEELRLQTERLTEAKEKIYSLEALVPENLDFVPRIEFAELAGRYNQMVRDYGRMKKELEQGAEAGKSAPAPLVLAAVPKEPEVIIKTELKKVLDVKLLIVFFLVALALGILVGKIAFHPG